MSIFEQLDEKPLSAAIDLYIRRYRKCWLVVFTLLSIYNLRSPQHLIYHQQNLLETFHENYSFIMGA